MHLEEIANILGIKVSNGSKKASGFQIDSRLVKPGDIFVALSDKRDGHDFVTDAYKKGAIAAIVSKKIEENRLPLIHVHNVLEALNSIAKHCRKKFQGTLIAITGSTGKTTVKEMIANILQQDSKTLYSHKTFNNHIGVPLTLCRLNNSYKYAVLELGANHLGELIQLSKLAKPHIAIINNISEAHIAEFGSFQNIIKAKSEIFSGVCQNGIAIINDHDKKITKQLKTASSKLRNILFNINKGSISAKNIQLFADSSKFTAVIPDGSMEIKLNIPGRHNIENALSAISATHELVSKDYIINGLETLQSIPGRLRSIQLLKDIWIIDDTYNASPNSVIAAIQYLSTLEGHKTLVLSDMAELGDRLEYHHKQIGTFAKSLGINQVYTVGKDSKITSKFFGENGQHFLTKNELTQHLINNIHKEKFVLIKGSRSSKMENIVNSLISYFQ